MSAIDHVTDLVAQTTHGPGMHGPVLMALVLVVAVGGLVYLVRSRTSRTRSEHDPASERIPRATPRATEAPDPESDRDPDA